MVPHIDTCGMNKSLTDLFYLTILCKMLSMCAELAFIELIGEGSIHLMKGSFKALDVNVVANQDVVVQNE